MLVRGGEGGCDRAGAWGLELSHFVPPSQVWKLGWSPTPGGDFGTVFPEIPVEFLQEKEVFKEFIYRINTLGRRSSSRPRSVPALGPRPSALCASLPHERPRPTCSREGVLSAHTHPRVCVSV